MREVVLDGMHLRRVNFSPGSARRRCSATLGAVAAIAQAVEDQPQARGRWSAT